LILEAVPSDPARDEYRQGNTLGPDYRHWRRAKIGRRFRVFFRYDSKAKIIVFAWVNDEQTLRAAGSKSDPYAVFEKCLHEGIRHMIGKAWLPQVGLIGLHNRRHNKSSA
jgi:toxin YhaV